MNMRGWKNTENNTHAYKNPDGFWQARNLSHNQNLLKAFTIPESSGISAQKGGGKMRLKALYYDADNVQSRYLVIGIVNNIKNGCCKDQPILITATYNPAIGRVYSCQCGCGCWCTTGHPTPSGALKDYQTMSNRNVPLDDDYVRR